MTPAITEGDSVAMWLVACPPGWRATQFGRELRIHGGLVDPTTSRWQDTVLIAPDHIESGTGRVLAFETAAAQGADSGKYVARADQILFSKIRPALSKVTLAPLDCLISADMYAISGLGRVDHRFVMYYMLAAPFHGFASAMSARVKMPKLNRDELSRAPLLVPPLEEQRAIADYLDRETARIDELIAKQERLIELLRERRRAVWAQAYREAARVGQATRLRRVVDSIVDGPFGSALTSSHYADTGARVIRLGNIGLNVFRTENEAYVPLSYAQRLSAHRAEAGDVVIAGLGDENMPLGRAAVVPEIGPALVKADCYRVRPTPSVSAEYLAWVLSAPSTLDQFRLLARGSTRARLNTSVVQQVEIAVPSREVQRCVLAAFSRDTARIDALIAKAERFIELSKERRAALITAAVTGQIDVRAAA